MTDNEADVAEAIERARSSVQCAAKSIYPSDKLSHLAEAFAELESIDATIDDMGEYCPECGVEKGTT